MKTIGLLGGMSWESTITYYQVINTVVKEKLGGLHSAKCILYSVEFQEIEECQASGNWDKSVEILAKAAQSLEKAGADFILICTNTMHKVFDKVQDKIAIPILHIATLTANVLEENGIGKVGLLGTKYTMEQDFYKNKLVDRGIQVIVPDEQDRKLVNQVIFDELCLGIVRKESKKDFLKIIEKLRAQGAEGVILGCTEIGLLLNQQDTDIVLFDTTFIHAEKAAIYALE